MTRSRSDAPAPPITIISETSDPNSSKSLTPGIDDLIKNKENPVDECAELMNKQGLIKEVFDFLQPWTLTHFKDKKPSFEDSQHLCSAIDLVVTCFSKLNMVAKRDTYLEELVKIYPENWQVLEKVGQIYPQNSNGFIISGNFERGGHRGGGEQAWSNDRDRVRALQLFVQAIPFVDQYAQEGGNDAPNKIRAAEFYLRFASYMFETSNWKLQALTNIEILPDYQRDYPNRFYYGRNNVKAPVDENGNPVFYAVPTSYQEAKSDGERWRWLLNHAVELSDSKRAEVALNYGNFLQSQFGVQTLRDYDFFTRRNNSTVENAGSIWSLQTLNDNETIAKLATGVKRFEFPEEQNYIKWYELALEVGTEDQKIDALTRLANEYSNRRQYNHAAEIWQQLLTMFPKREQYERDSWQQSLNQIVKNWGRFESVQATAHNNPTELQYTFRNGDEVEFTATEIKYDLLLKDVQDYITEFCKQSKSQPNRGLNWEKVQFESIGYRLVCNDLTQENIKNDRSRYLGKQIASWTTELNPPADHFDGQETVSTPLQKSGCYLIEAQMKDGNKSAVIVWINDSAIVQKSLGSKIMYFVADAQTGAPIPNAPVSFFGYKNNWSNNRMTYECKQFEKKTDENGLIYFDKNSEFNFDMQWLVILNSSMPKNAVGATIDRFAYLGFNRYWSRDSYDEEYNQVRAYFMTDRPVYRPEQKAEYKFWVETSKYDMPDVSEYAEKEVRLIISNPRGEEILNETVKLDKFGGYAGTLELAKDAMLGQYNFAILSSDQTQYFGNGYCRVEEYKKPEFEVTVDAPKEPVKLGDKFKAKITAKYYFGAPVVNATVKYKVERQKNISTWFPVRPWDWFYGNGYAWFGYDYSWYPGWAKWGCCRPIMSWYPQTYDGPAELILDQEVQIGEDGTVDVELDTSLIKEIFPDDDQKYTISAEVVDQSRRTITGNGTVLVAKEPFKVYAWVDRGFYDVRQQINASFQARRLDGKGVSGEAVIQLKRIEYKISEDGKTLEPIETVVYETKAKTDEQGAAKATFSADTAGQYRVVCNVTDASGNVKEGGYIFSIRNSNAKKGTDSFRFSQIELIPEKSEYNPGEKVRLQINTDQPNSTVLYFLRPSDSAGYMTPEVVSLNGQSKTMEFDVLVKDMPNFFVEALTVANGQVYTETKKIVVPPEKRIVNVEVLPSKTNYKPGEKAKAEIRVTDQKGLPVSGQVVVSIYDKSVEYIATGGNSGDIREFFWKWQRLLNPSHQSNLGRYFSNMVPWGQTGMNNIGVFGDVFPMMAGFGGGGLESQRRERGAMLLSKNSPDQELVMMDAVAPAPLAAAPAETPMMGEKAMATGAANFKAKAEESIDLNIAGDTFGVDRKRDNVSADKNGGALVEAEVRKNFADTAYWNAILETNNDGVAEIELDMPENLTTWKIKVWTMGLGTKVGEGATEVLTKKNLIIRMQKPRFLIQTDQILLSANVHNYLETEKDVQVSLEFPATEFKTDESKTDESKTDESKTDESKTEVAKTNASGNTDALKNPVEEHCLKLVAESDSNDAVRTVKVPANGETRIDWLVEAKNVGTATVLMKALTDEESDAMQDTFPVYVHGILKQEAFSGVIRPTFDEKGNIVEKSTDMHSFVINVPEERRPEETKLTVRFSPTLAGSMIEALPYLTAYPYGCTEQTLNRFLPTVLTQKTLLDMGVDLKKLESDHANLNAQELGDPKVRREQWKKLLRGNAEEEMNPVYSIEEVAKRTKEGVDQLTSMQCSDGGWGWFSGFGEYSSAHLTALIVHGLHLAQKADVAVDPNVIERGEKWLVNYQQAETQKIRNGEIFTDEEKRDRWNEWKENADDLDAFVYMVLSECAQASQPLTKNDNDPKWTEETARQLMKNYLWDVRAKISLYAVSMYGLAMHFETLTPPEKLDISVNADRITQCIRILSQYLHEDNENQTAWLDLGSNGLWGGRGWCWWSWYGSEFETQAYYLKLLAWTNPKSSVAPKLVKYLLNNRKNATYWNSTRDTAICVEAFADYIRQTGEDKANMTVEILFDGEVKKTTEITPENMFMIDNTLVLEGVDVSTGKHTVDIRRTGNGPVYMNVYLQNFTLENRISKTGLEVKVDRKYYKLIKDDKAVNQVAGGRGQVVTQKIEKYTRVPLQDGEAIESGQLIEVEMTVDSKNDYESILIEDKKAAGFEPVELQSGYNGNALGAYVEFRDERVCFFVYQLARGTHSVSYQLRAEQPGTFSALPSVIWGMYAPELKGNSDEFKTKVVDKNSAE